MRTEKFKLKNIAKVGAGNSAPDKDDFSDYGIPFIRAGSLAFLTTGGSLDKCEKIDKQLAAKNNLKLFPKSSILFAKSGMSAKMGRVYELPVEAYVVSHLAVIHPNADILNPSYLKYFLLYRPPFHLIKDVAYPSIKVSDIDELEIDLPDLLTQNKIVSVLEKASSLVTKREESIAMLDELLRATFLDLFQFDLLNFRKGSKPLSQIASIVSGLTKGRKTKEANLLEVPYLRVANAQDGYFNLNEIKNITATKREIEQYTIIKGDILITEGGDPDKLGRGAVWELENNKFIYQNHLYRLRINNSEEYSPYWLIQLLGSEYGKYYFLRQAKQTTGIATVNKRQVSSFPVPNSSYTKQKQFELYYLRIKKNQIILSNSLIEFKTLLNSILQRVFNGQINFNVDFELDALIREIDLQKKENDLSKIVGDIAYLQRLVDKLNSQEFKEKDMYDKAKHGVFQLVAVKEEDRKVIQEYDEKSKSLKLALK